MFDNSKKLPTINENKDAGSKLFSGNQSLFDNKQETFQLKTDSSQKPTLSLFNNNTELKLDISKPKQDITKSSIGDLFNQMRAEDSNGLGLENIKNTNLNEKEPKLTFPSLEKDTMENAEIKPSLFLNNNDTTNNGVSQI